MRRTGAAPPAMARYSIHATINRVADEAYLVVAEATALPGTPGPEIERRETCDPCSYANARAAAYKFVAGLTLEIEEGGHKVADVMILDEDRRTHRRSSS